MFTIEQIKDLHDRLLAEKPEAATLAGVNRDGFAARDRAAKVGAGHPEGDLEEPGSDLAAVLLLESEKGAAREEELLASLPERDLAARRNPLAPDLDLTLGDLRDPFRVPRDRRLLAPPGDLLEEEPEDVVQQRQGVRIACVEEIAFRSGWIDAEQVARLAEPMRSNDYGRYLLALLAGGETT